MAGAEKPRNPAAPLRWRIALMAALPMEVRPFLRRHKARRLPDLGLPAWEFAVGQGRGVLVLSGMGGEAARRAGTRLLARCRPEILVSLGFGGALTPELAPGALVLGESFWHFNPDSGVLEQVPAPPPPRPLPALLRGLKEAGLPACPGSLVTTPGIIHKERQGAPLLRLPRPVLDLESSALAALAAEEGLALLGLRAVTDAAGEEIPDFLAQRLRRGQRPGPRAALTGLAADPRRAAALLHLRRRGRAAARHLAAALALLLPMLGD